MVRPREMRARKRPTKGAQAIHHAQKNSVQAFIQSVGRSYANVSRVMDGKRLMTSPMFCTMPSSRKLVLPATSTNSIRATAMITLSSDSRRMPFSTPETTETVAITTDRAIRPICTERFSGMPNMKFNP